MVARRRREKSGRRRDDEYITYGGESRFESCAGSIVLLRGADRSLSLSHAALIAHRSLIYRVGGKATEKDIRIDRERGETVTGSEGNEAERERKRDGQEEQEIHRGREENR